MRGVDRRGRVQVGCTSGGWVGRTAPFVGFHGGVGPLPPPPGLLQGRPPHIPLRSFLFNQPWSDPSLVEKTVQPHPQLPQGRCIRHVVDWDRRGEPRRRPRRINARRGEASTSKGRDEGRRERTNRTVRLCQPNATPSVDPSTRQPTTW